MHFFFFLHFLLFHFFFPLSFCPKRQGTRLKVTSSRASAANSELHFTFKRMNVSRRPRSILAGGLLSSSHPPKQPPMYPTTRLLSLEGGGGGGGSWRTGGSRHVRSHFVPGAAQASLRVPLVTRGRLHLNKQLPPPTPPPTPNPPVLVFFALRK